MATDDLPWLPATDALRLIRDGSLSAQRYAEVLLARRRLWRNLNATTWMDEARVLQAAHAVDRARDEGHALGSLAGLPLLVKDNIDTMGDPTSAGTATLKHSFPVADAPLVARLREQGALIWGKANMHELAAGGTSSNPVFGAVLNPHDVSRVAGGSSGGNAAAIAAGLVPTGLGTDTAGSVRIPASFCGIAALRPSSLSPRLYDDRGLVPLALGLDTIGPMARSVSDVALLHRAITGAPMPRRTPLRRVRLGVPREPFWQDLQPSVAHIAAATSERLQAAGAVLVDIDLAEVAREASALQRELTLSRAHADLKHHLESRQPRLSIGDVLAGVASADVRSFYEASRTARTLLSHLADAQAARVTLQGRCERMMKRQQVAAVIFPTVPVTAPAVRSGGDAAGDLLDLGAALVSQATTITRHTRFAACLGLPALTLPMGIASCGLPAGVELTGYSGRDVALLALGMAVQDQLGPTPRPRRNHGTE